MDYSQIDVAVLQRLFQEWRAASRRDRFPEDIRNSIKLALGQTDYPDEAIIQEFSFLSNLPASFRSTGDLRLRIKAMLSTLRFPDCSGRVMEHLERVDPKQTVTIVWHSLDQAASEFGNADAEKDRLLT